MLISLQDFSHIDYSTASGPAKSRLTRLALGEQDAAPQLAACLSNKLRTTYHDHLLSLSKQSLGSVLV
jgi:hypothetical protein